MNSYIIKSINERLSVSHIINEELKPIKIDGDLSFPLRGFWGSFKRKIEYEESEKLCFVILTDDEHFEIDASIAIAEQFNIADDKLQSLLAELDISEKLHLIFYPEVTFDSNPDLSNSSNIKAQQQSIEDTSPELIRPNSLQNYFRKKTNAIKAIIKS